MKVQSINSNYNNYRNQQNRKAPADKLSFGMVKLGPVAIETITDAVTNGYSDINAAKYLKKALKGVRCNLKGAFLQYQCSAHDLHSKFAEKAEKYFAIFKNPEDVELTLDLTKCDRFWGDEKVISQETNWPATKDYESSRKQYLGKTPYLCSPEESSFTIGRLGRYNESYYDAAHSIKDMYVLKPDIIIDEVGGLSTVSEKEWDSINRCYHQKYRANYINHDVVAQLADLLNGLEAKCYDALLSVPAKFNERLYSKFPEKTHTQQSKEAARQKVINMLSD